MNNKFYSFQYQQCCLLRLIPFSSISGSNKCCMMLLRMINYALRFYRLFYCWGTTFQLLLYWSFTKCSIARKSWGSVSFWMLTFSWWVLIMKKHGTAANTENYTLRQHIHRRWFCANDKHCLCDGDGKQTQYKVAICQVKFHNFFIWSSWLKSTMTILAIWYSSYSRSGPRNSSLWCTMQCTNCSSRPPSTNRPYILPQCNLL